MENTCITCHKQGKGCCFFKVASESQQIGLFLDDIEIIEKHINKNMDYFIEIDRVSDKFLNDLLSTSYPLFDKIFFRNIRYKLKTIEERCIFLNEDGCELPIGVRPLFCRVYPFWPSQDFKNIYVLPSSDCLAQEKSTINWEIVNRHFGYSKNYLNDLFQQMKEYCENHLTKSGNSNDFVGN